MDIEGYLKEKREKIEKALDRYLPGEDEFPTILHRAMRYSAFAGGKRIRPIFTIATAEALGKRDEEVMALACAIELIHTYSLIHDDLPAMDDDDWRRGRPTCHKVFGEAIAILAGDALLTLAFDVMASMVEGERDPARVLRVIKEVAGAAGSMGMVGGQAVDMESQGKRVDFPVLEYIHIHKTGALILASIRAGAIISGAGERELQALTEYGEAVGLAFQIVDDILDVEGNRELMGKETGVDALKGKATYPSIVGLEESKRRVRELADRAVSSLSIFGERGWALRSIARFIAERTR